MTDKSAENIRGILLLTLGMASVTSLDAIAKALSAHISLSWVQTGVGLGAFVGFRFLIGRKQRLFTCDFMHPAALTRTISDAAGSFLIIIALSLVPLSVVTVIMQTAPLMITLGAVLFLGERAAWQDWAALAAGFAGMLLIVRPGGESVGLAVLFAVGAAIAFSTRDLASRAAPRGATTFQLGAWGGGALAVTGVFASVVGGHPPPPVALTTLGIFAAIVVLITLGLYCITTAMRIGDVAVIAPFRYTRLLFGVGLGIVFFGEKLDWETVIGGAVIVASGLYVWRRERRRRRLAA